MSTTVVVPNDSEKYVTAAYVYAVLKDLNEPIIKTSAPSIYDALVDRGGNVVLIDVDVPEITSADRIVSGDDPVVIAVWKHVCGDSKYHNMIPMFSADGSSVIDENGRVLRQFNTIDDELAYLQKRGMIERGFIQFKHIRTLLKREGKINTSTLGLSQTSGQNVILKEYRSVQNLTSIGRVGKIMDIKSFAIEIAFESIFPVLINNIVMAANQDHQLQRISAIILYCKRADGYHVYVRRRAGDSVSLEPLFTLMKGNGNPNAFTAIIDSLPFDDQTKEVATVRQQPNYNSGNDVYFGDQIVSLPSNVECDMDDLSEVNNVPVQAQESNNATSVQEPTSEPVVQEPTSEPVVQEPTSEPVVQEPTSEPVVQEPTSEPVIQGTAIDISTQGLVIDVSTQGATVCVSTSDTPAQEPVVDTPAQEPVVDTPAQEPVVDTPAQEPVVDTPAQEPVVDTPAQEPVVDTQDSQEIQINLSEPLINLLHVYTSTSETAIQESSANVVTDVLAPEPIVDTPAIDDSVQKSTDDQQVEVEDQQVEIEDQQTNTPHNTDCDDTGLIIVSPPDEKSPQIISLENSPHSVQPSQDSGDGGNEYDRLSRVLNAYMQQRDIDNTRLENPSPSPSLDVTEATSEFSEVINAIDEQVQRMQKIITAKKAHISQQKQVINAFVYLKKRQQRIAALDEQISHNDAIIAEIAELASQLCDVD
jgi:hypothetical protein